MVGHDHPGHDGELLCRGARRLPRRLHGDLPARDLEPVPLARDLEECPIGSVRSRTRRSCVAGAGAGGRERDECEEACADRPSESPASLAGARRCRRMCGHTVPFGGWCRPAPQCPAAFRLNRWIAPRIRRLAGHHASPESHSDAGATMRPTAGCRSAPAASLGRATVTPSRSSRVRSVPMAAPRTDVLRGSAEHVYKLIAVIPRTHEHTVTAQPLHSRALRRWRLDDTAPLDTAWRYR